MEENNKSRFEHICENCIYSLIVNLEDKNGFRDNRYMCTKFKSYWRQVKRFEGCPDFKNWGTDYIKNNDVKLP